MNKTTLASKLYASTEQTDLISVLKQYGNGLRFWIPISQAFWDTNIDCLNLAVRSRNGLMRAKATTIGETAELIMSEGGLESTRNLGRKSVAEIKTAVLVEAYNQLGPKGRLSFWEHFVENNHIG